MLRTAAGLFSIVMLTSAWTFAAVSVHKSPPSVHRQTFDPDKPPAQLPHLAPGEAAVTVCSFGFSAQPDYQVISQQREVDGSWTVVIAVNGVIVDVRLNIVIWTPKNASNKLKAHEEGHRKLDETMYQKLSEDAARAAGTEMEGHQFTGKGQTTEKAVADALTGMFKKAGADYLAHSSAVNAQINEVYDGITEHGTNEVTEEDAMKEAIARYDANKEQGTADRR